MDQEFEKRKKVKELLDSVGPGFCLAKWNQVTIHLGTGLNHSCHHPAPHKISESEVLRNPTHLHNTLYKKKCWREMLSGQRPKECEYCWRIEDTSEEFSDRVYKSSEPWALPTFEEVKNSYWMDDYYPRYVEISFSNRCNFKCLYCAPNFSSRWNEEAKQYGAINLPGVLPLNGPIDTQSEWRCQNVEKNPLVEAFWSWFPELFRRVHSLRLTGGEPLLLPESYKIMEYMRDNAKEAQNLKFFAINTNLGMSDAQFEKLVNLYIQLQDVVPELCLFTSIESGKKEAEYVRFGLDYEKFWWRMEELVKRVPKLTVTVMATYNALSVSSFKAVLDNIYRLKKEYTTAERVYGTSVMLDTSFIRHPSFFDIHVLDRNRVEWNIQNCIDFVKARKQSWFDDGFTPGFCDLEIGKIARLLDYYNSDLEGFNKEEEKKKLRMFLEEEDRRRGTNYKDVWTGNHSLDL